MVLWVAEALRCAKCRAPITKDGKQLICTQCGQAYPIVDDIPVLINDDNSVFTINDFIDRKSLFFNLTPKTKVKSALKRLKPTISANILGQQNYARLAERLHGKSTRAKVLVLGGSILGKGMEALVNDDHIELCKTDVSYGPRTNVVCDAHDIPFADGTFDCVIIQAVLEHVVDPVRCVSEVWRVLKPEGIVYSETAFMQPVHGGRYDFTRYTHLGHRRLFANFDEIDSGAVCGPGMAVALTWMNFMRSFSTGKIGRKLLGGMSSFLASGYKYFDHLLINRPAALDCAAGVYFMGTKSESTLTDRELISLYRGAY